MVKATSFAVRGVPSENFASSRIENVQVRLSLEHSYEVARSFWNFMSLSVTTRVDWMSGSCTCSPAPQPTQGSKPPSGSLVVLMAMVTWCFASTAALSEPPASVPALSEHPASMPEADRAANPVAASAWRRVRVYGIDRSFVRYG